MVQLESSVTWIKHGRQKSAVARAIIRPMTPGEIWRDAQQLNPHIQLRDIWFILQQFQQRGLVRCFNPDEVTGKVCFWTDLGRKVVEAAFGLHPSNPPVGIDWRCYSFVVRAKIRRLILHELSQPRSASEVARTATRIRRRVNEMHPVGLNPILRALRDLREVKLVEIAGVADKRRQKLYRLTPLGTRIAKALA